MKKHFFCLNGFGKCMSTDVKNRTLYLTLVGTFAVVARAHKTKDFSIMGVFL